MKRLTLKEKVESRCVHFNGVQNETCKAGVKYSDFPKGVFPCLKHHCQPGPCAKLQWPTTEQVAKEIADRETQTAKFTKVLPLIAKIKREHKGASWKGEDVCPVCGNRIILTHSAYNGHVWGKCVTEGCVGWIE